MKVTNRHSNKKQGEETSLLPLLKQYLSMNKSTRKKIIHILLWPILLSPSSAIGQGAYRCPTFDLKQHQLGVGVSTTLFDDVESINQYLKTVNCYNVFSLHTVQSSFYSIFFDYQFRFNDSWSIEARLKYKHRSTLQYLTFATDGGIGMIGHVNTVYNDFAIPVTINFRWVTREGSGIELFGGIGLTTLGMLRSDARPFDFIDSRNTRGEIDIEYSRSIELYGLIGFQFEIPYGTFSLKPFVSISYSPAGNAKYTVTPTTTNSAITKKTVSPSMNLCELECGLILQF